MTYNNFDVVAVPFPFTDRNTTKKRPALVINKQEYQCKTGHLILLMITSAEHSSWYSDINIEDLNSTGLKKASVIRFKVFSLDERLIIKKIGCLSEQDKIKVKENLVNTIELT
jgi:mRNA interferase MazF